jgi:hypothetical protein
MNSAWPRRVSLINAKGLPTILSPTISATTGDRPAASGFTPASTGFVFNSETRPSTPTESSSRRQPVGRLCYGLVILVPLLSTTHCCVAVTVRYRTALRRTEADFHRSILLPSQAHEFRLQAVAANHCGLPRKRGTPETGSTLIKDSFKVQPDSRIQAAPAPEAKNRW